MTINIEIGFGSGLSIKKHALSLSRIAGLDCSEDMVKLAMSLSKELVESGKAEFMHGDVSALPWKDNEFSVVVGIETFYFWSELKAALKEIRENDPQKSIKSCLSNGSPREIRTPVLVYEHALDRLSLIDAKPLWKSNLSNSFFRPINQSYSDGNCN